MKKPKKKYVVELAGVPCRMATSPAFGFKLIPRTGTLLPDGSAPYYFPGQKSAHKAIMRANRLRRKILESVVTPTDAMRPFAQDGIFSIVEASLG